MAAVDPDQSNQSQGLQFSIRQWFMDRVASRDFQKWASQFVLTRWATRRDAARLFDLVAGFTYSQTLFAAASSGLLEQLRDGPQSAARLAPKLGLDTQAAEILCRAAAGLDLIGRRADGSYRLARLGAACLGAPGLKEMICHHEVLYRDLADPVGLLAGTKEPELAKFWPYVLSGAKGDLDHEAAATYSDLMARSQDMVAQETLRLIELSGIRSLLDVGGGTGAFAQAVRQRYSAIELAILDLPSVVAPATARLEAGGIVARAGSFLDPIEPGHDAVSLIRVLYDHSDETVARILSNIYDSLPGGGRLIISEPMSGGDRPNKAGDVYFALYTFAMKTGKARSAAEISDLLKSQGFEKIKQYRSPMPFLTSCISARKPV